MRFHFRVNFSSFNVYTGKPLLEWLCQIHTFLHCKHCFSNIRHTRFTKFLWKFKDIEGRLMGVVIFLRMGKKCIIKQLTSVQPPFCNIVTYSVLTEQLRKFVPQERLFTCYTWLISSSRSRPIPKTLEKMMNQFSFNDVDIVKRWTSCILSETLAHIDTHLIKRISVVWMWRFQGKQRKIMESG